MNTNELRLGNWIWSTYGQYDRIECRVTAIHLGYVNTTYDNSKAELRVIEPIPLTEERLEKFGFEESLLVKGIFEIDCGEYKMNVVKNLFSGSLKKDPSWFVSILTGYASQPVTVVQKYTHQIQNLYFDLAGEELTIKEQ